MYELLKRLPGDLCLGQFSQQAVHFCPIKILKEKIYLKNNINDLLNYHNKFGKVPLDSTKIE